MILFLLCHSQRYSRCCSLISQSSHLVMSCHIDEEDEDTENNFIERRMSGMGVYGLAWSVLLGMKMLHLLGVL